MIAKEKNTKIIALLLAIIMILMNIMPVTSSAINEINKATDEQLNTLATPTVSMSSTCSSITPGSTITVNVYVTGATITSFTGTMSYDATVFSPLAKSSFSMSSYATSGTYGDWGCDGYNTSTKIVLFSESNASYYQFPNGDALFQIAFQVLSTATASSTVVGINSISVDNSGGTVTTGLSTSLTLPTSAKYNLVVNPNGGTWDTYTTSQTYSLSAGETKTIDLPTRTGYTFTGWTTSPSTSGSTISGTQFTMGTAATTLTANWTAATYTITMDPQGGTYNGSTTYSYPNSAYGSTVSISAAVPPAGYTVSYDLNGGIYSGSTTIANSTQTLTFNGWSVTSGTAGWTAGSKTGTLTVQGNATLTANYTKNSITLPSNPTKAGYTFAGWYTSGGTSVGTTTYLPTANTSLIAHWNEVTYNITYNLNGGSNSSSAPATYSASTLPLTIPDPTKTGYTFSNWTVVIGGTTTTQSAGYSIPAGTTGNVSLTANWTANNYTVKFNSNGGTGTMADEAFVYNTAKALTTNTFTRTGYTFTGWASVAGSTTAEYTDGQSVSTLVSTSNGVKQLYAVWTPISYNITYTLNGGGASPANPSTYSATNLPLLLNTPTKTGYIFTGWMGTNISSLAPTYTIPTGTTGNLSFTANWTPVSYTINFDANGGTGTMTPSSKTLNYDDSYTIPTSGYTKTGYILKGWSDTQTATVAKYGITDTLKNLTTTDKSTITLYAVWGTNSYNITYTGGGTASPANPTTYVVTDLPITLTAPTKTGYIFNGWIGSGIGAMTTTYTIPAGTTGDLSFAANWTPITYYVLYYGSGATSGSTATSTHTYDTPQALTTNPFTKTGYTFAGWSTTNGGTSVQYTDKQVVNNLSTTDASQIKLYAVWTANGFANYTTQFYKNDGTGTYTLADTQTQSATIGTTVTAATNSYTGYAENTTYSGRVVTGTVAADGSLVLKRYYDKSTANYTIQYYKNDGSGTYTLADTQTQSGTIGTTVNAPTNSYTGYTENTTYSGRVISGTVLADGSLVLKRYYDKNVASMIVTFIVNQSGSTVSPTSETVINGQAYGILPTPTAVDGYEFQGWYAEPTYSIQVTSSTIVTATTDHYLYAKWKKTKVTVTFETTTSDSTVSPKTQTYNIGTTYGTLPTPTDRNGYTFAGWYADTAYTSKIDTSTVVTGTTDYTVYAKWTPIKYTITYQNVDGATNTNPKTYTIADSNITLADATKVGYNFDGWYADSALTQPITTIITGEQLNVTVYAKWQVQQTPGTVIYYVKNSFENDPNTDQNTFFHFEDAKRYCDQINSSTNPVVVWDANGAIVYNPEGALYLKSSKYYIGDFKGTSLDEWKSGDPYLFNINVNTTIAALIANLQTNGTIKIYDKNHTEITDTSMLVGTGMQLVDIKGKEQIDLDIIVRGDVDGNGKCTITDLSTLNQYLTGKSILSGIYLKGSDMDLNGKTSITDLSSMNQILISGNN